MQCNYSRGGLAQKFNLDSLNQEELAEVEKEESDTIFLNSVAGGILFQKENESYLAQ